LSCGAAVASVVAEKRREEKRASERESHGNEKREKVEKK
jgi:hypothetical protein